jgi:hypothetical protein
VFLLVLQVEALTGFVPNCVFWIYVHQIASEDTDVICLQAMGKFAYNLDKEA